MKYPAICFKIILTIFLCIFSSGCVFLVVGTAGAVGGYAISRDTLEGVSSKSQEELMAAAHRVLSIIGTITDNRPKDGTIVGIVSGARVIVNVIQVNLTTSRLRVKARQFIFPRVGVAQDLYTKIMNQLD